MTKKIMCAAAFLFLSAACVYADEYQAARFFLLGNSPAVTARGGAGLASYGGGMLFYNQASSAKLDGLYLSLPAAYAYKKISFGADAAVPTAYGVVGGVFRRAVYSEDESENTMSYAALSIARQATERLSLGLGVNTLYSAGRYSGFYFGGTISALYRIPFSAHFADAWGILRPSFALVVQPGAVSSKHVSETNLAHASAGLHADFFRNRFVTAGIFSDALFLYGNKKIYSKTGVETKLFGDWYLRAGTILPQAYGLGNVTLGAGYRTQLADGVDAGGDFSAVHVKGNLFSYYGSLNVHLAFVDYNPPVISVSPSCLYISPNSDGAQDFLLFNVKIRDSDSVKGWSLQIMDAAGHVVREFRIEQDDRREALTAGAVIKKLLRPRAAVFVPESVFWDGTDAKGKTLPDGKYMYSFYAWDVRDNISPRVYGYVFIDTAFPDAAVSCDDLLFSPNFDGRKDVLPVKVKVISSEESDRWTAGFVNEFGITVRSFHFKGNAVPAVIEWDGRDDAGVDTPEGLYSFFVEAVDNAGNSIRREIKEISLTRRYESADVTASCEYFSCGNKHEADIKFFPRLTAAKDLSVWKIFIENSDKKVVSVIEGTDLLPAAVSWNVCDVAGKKLPDGIYTYRLLAEFKSGNQPESFHKKLVLCKTPPVCTVACSPKLFVPDKETGDAVLAIRLHTESLCPIKDWQVSVVAGSGTVIKTFSGKGVVPEKIIWNGRGDNGEQVESAAEYTVQFGCTDYAGNKSACARTSFSVGVIVIQGERLLIRIMHVDFALGGAQLTPDACKALDKVRNMLMVYKSYSIAIECHTDDDGSEEFNVKLSEIRARVVMEYLVSHGIDASRLSFRGMGRTAPLSPGTDEISRKKNRRVEFILTNRIYEKDQYEQ